VKKKKNSLKVYMNGLIPGRDPQPVNPDEVELCLRFLIDKQQCITKTVIRSITSYGWKHYVENWIETTLGEHHYVSNGAFIRAALDFGLTVLPLPHSPNAYINLGRKAITKK